MSILNVWTASQMDGEKYFVPGNWTNIHSDEVNGIGSTSSWLLLFRKICKIGLVKG